MASTDYIPAWIRPLDVVPYPNVWLEFEAKESKFSGKLVKYRIQDLPENRFHDAVQHMNEYYLVDEPLSKSIGKQRMWYKFDLVELIETILFSLTPDGHLDENYIADYARLWRGAIAQKTTLVCFRDGYDEIVGLNVLLFNTKNDTFTKQIEAQTKTKDFLDIFRVHAICYENFSPYDKYNVDRYIGSVGLSVQPKYRGIALGTRMLEAR